MKILIACEESQVVTKAFRAKGHEAYSCDIKPCSGGHPEWHIIGDAIKEAYSGKYDLMIAHPPCTYLSNSGVRWLWEDIERWNKLIDGAVFFKKLLDAPILKKILENPIPHKYGMKIIQKKYSQIIQPYHHGHPESKSTCLWVEGLPMLEKSNDVETEFRNLPKNKAQRLHYLPPGPDRARLRATTFTGIGLAFAEQWG